MRLVLLVAGSILPLALIASITTYYLAEAGNEAASVRLLQLARTLLGTVEARIGAATTATQVLAVSTELQKDDLQGFRGNAEAFLKAFAPGASFVLSNPDGMQLVNTAARDPLERRSVIRPEVLEAHREVFAQGKPVVSRLFFGQVNSEHSISINVPVQRDGNVVYNIGFPITSDTLSNMLVEQRLQESWTIAIWDRAGTVIARSRDWKAFVGHKAAPSIYPAIMERRDQVLSTVTFDGVRVLTALAHSPRLGLTLAVGVPEALIAGPRRQALLQISIFSAIAFLASGLFAAHLAGQVLKAERHRDLLIRELNHREGNLLMMIQSITAQTMRSAPTKEEGTKRLQERLMALSRAHQLPTGVGTEPARVRQLVASALEPFLEASGNIEMSGDPDVRVDPQAAVAVTLTLNELATNAIKYGALSVPDGKVALSWHIEQPDTLILQWSESGGPEVQVPARKGFGSTLIERGLSDILGSSASIEYRPSGIVCVLRCPIRTS